MSWSRRTRSAAAVAALLLSATALTACGSGADEAAAPSGESGAGFPVTLKNTFGETTIKEKPARSSRSAGTPRTSSTRSARRRSGCRR